MADQKTKHLRITNNCAAYTKKNATSFSAQINHTISNIKVLLYHIEM